MILSSSSSLSTSRNLLWWAEVQRNSHGFPSKPRNRRERYYDARFTHIALNSVTIATICVQRLSSKPAPTRATSISIDKSSTSNSPAGYITCPVLDSDSVVCAGGRQMMRTTSTVDTIYWLCVIRHAGGALSARQQNKTAKWCGTCGNALVCGLH